MSVFGWLSRRIDPIHPKQIADHIVGGAISAGLCTHTIFEEDEWTGRAGSPGETLSRVVLEWAAFDFFCLTYAVSARGLDEQDWRKSDWAQAVREKTAIKLAALRRRDVRAGADRAPDWRRIPSAEAFEGVRLGGQRYFLLAIDDEADGEGIYDRLAINATNHIFAAYTGRLEVVQGRTNVWIATCQMAATHLQLHAQLADRMSNLLSKKRN